MGAPPAPSLGSKSCALVAQSAPTSHSSNSPKANSPVGIPSKKSLVVPSDGLKTRFGCVPQPE